MTDTKDNNVSATRMRLGVGLILLWWLPIWLLAPYINSAFSSTDSSQSLAIITTIIIVIQTMIGGFGVYIAGGPVMDIIKKTPRRKVPRTILRILLHGKLDDTV